MELLDSELLDDVSGGFISPGAMRTVYAVGKFFSDNARGFASYLDKDQQRWQNYVQDQFEN